MTPIEPDPGPDPGPLPRRDLLPLRGRVGVVTGVSRRSGIGYAIARRLAALGASLFLHHYTPHDREQPWGADPGGPRAVVAGVAQALADDDASVHDVEVDLAAPDAPGRLIAAATGADEHSDRRPTIHHAHMAARAGRNHPHPAGAVPGRTSMDAPQGQVGGQIERSWSASTRSMTSPGPCRHPNRRAAARASPPPSFPVPEYQLRPAAFCP